MKSRFQQAIQLQQEACANMKAGAAAAHAGYPEHAAQFQVDADLNNEAVQALMQPAAFPAVVAGEVVPAESELPDHRGGWRARDTLAAPDTPALAASLARTELLAQSRLDVLALGVDAAAAAGCNDSLSKLLAHQAALAHAAAFKLTDRAMEQDNSVEVARLVNAAGRMMAAFQQALLVLHRLKHGGTQVISVQHINLQAGQAVVTGSLQAGVKPPLTGESE
jgi:hypothetical protein